MSFEFKLMPRPFVRKQGDGVRCDLILKISPVLFFQESKMLITTILLFFHGKREKKMVNSDLNQYKTALEIFNTFVYDYDNFRGEQMAPYLDQNISIPLVTVLSYAILVVLLGQIVMSRLPAFTMSLTTKVWNFLLAGYSLIGAYYMIPYLWKHLNNEGLHVTVCNAGYATWGNGRIGVFMALFMWSKYVELFDTVLLVLKKKDVIFLHWYHHITVLLFCWKAFSVLASGGIWFAALNYGIHSIMYSYYFLMCFDCTRPLVRPMASTVTLLQIVQMLAGTSIVVYQRWFSGPRNACRYDDETNYYAIVMYASYLVLFVLFFVNTYILRKKKASSRGALTTHRIQGDDKKRS